MFIGDEKELHQEPLGSALLTFTSSDVGETWRWAGGITYLIKYDLRIWDEEELRRDPG